MMNPGKTDESLRIGEKLIVPEFSAPEKYNVTECSSEQKFYAGGELSKLWEKPIFDDTHKLVYDYANGWTIDPEFIKKNYPKEYYKENADGSIDVKMTMYFKPQSYFYLGLLISGGTLLLLVSYLVFDAYRRPKTSSHKKSTHDTTRAIQ